MKGIQTIRRAAALALVLPAVAFAQAKPATKPATKPAATPAAPAAGAATAATSTAALPSGREVIDRYIKAIGGREVLAKHNSIHQVATLNVPAAGMTAKVETFSARPNKAFERTTIPGMGEALEGFDGTTAWSISPWQGPRLISGKQLEQRQYRSAYDAVLHEGDSYKSIENTGVVDFEGTKAYKVKVVRANGDESFEYYDVNTNLLVGGEMTNESEMGQMTMTMVMSDYKEFDGVKMPTKVTVRSANGQSAMVTVESVQHNTVDPSVFELPAQIKALTGK